MVIATQSLASLQQPLFDDCLLEQALLGMSQANACERGAVFTRQEVTEFILDLCGYTAERKLYESRFLEPSFGGGDFLLPAVERLLESWRVSGDPLDPLGQLSDAIRAVELHASSYIEVKLKLVSLLERAGLGVANASTLASRWLVHGDYLLTAFEGRFEFVIGNPPYVRQELIPAVLLAEYRMRYSSIFDRADLYIPFIERSLRLLSADGVLGFICSDRWMKNKYGGPLRKIVADSFHLKACIDMVDTPAFTSDVIAYPAITLIGSGSSDGVTRFAKRPLISKQALQALAIDLCSQNTQPTSQVVELRGVVTGSEPWLLEDTLASRLLRRLEANFPLLEDVGCKVGIGVATGADKAFIGPFEALDVEPDCKLPLVTTKDIKNGYVDWAGLGVVNPFGKNGELVSLDEYPKLHSYLEARRAVIGARHVAKKSPSRWYKTIDRIYPELSREAKLLIPDIKGEAQVVYENNGLYPHHNLYYITASDWNLHALQAVLLSGIARLFVAAYSTKMRGGYLRFQAQYLRRIRLPYWADVSPQVKSALTQAALSNDATACNRAVSELYGLSDSEKHTLEASISGN